MELDGDAVLEESGCAKRHRSEDGAAIGFVKVGAHTGDVTHVVTHIVGNGGRVAGIILRDVLLDLAHDVSAHVGRLGIDTAADTGEEGLRRGAHSEGQHGGSDDDQRLGVRGLVYECAENEPPDRDVQQTETDDGQTHYGAAAEGDLKAGIERTHRRIGRTGGGVGRRLHPDESGQAGEETAGQEGERHPRILHVEPVRQHRKERGQHDKHDDDDLVLLFQVSHRTFAHILRNLFHRYGPLALLHHLTEENPREQKRHDRCRRDRIKNNIQIHKQ